MKIISYCSYTTKHPFGEKDAFDFYNKLNYAFR